MYGNCYLVCHQGKLVACQHFYVCQYPDPLGFEPPLEISLVPSPDLDGWEYVKCNSEEQFVHHQQIPFCKVRFATYDFVVSFWNVVNSVTCTNHK